MNSVSFAYPSFHFARGAINPEINVSRIFKFFAGFGGVSAFNLADWIGFREFVRIYPRALTLNSHILFR